MISGEMLSDGFLEVFRVVTTQIEDEEVDAPQQRQLVPVVSSLGRLALGPCF